MGIEDKKYSVSLKPGHPNGQMHRAGLIVHVEPQIVSLTEEQLKALQNDRYIIVNEAIEYTPAYPQVQPESEEYLPEDNQPKEEVIEEPKQEEVRNERKNKKRGRR